MEAITQKRQFLRFRDHLLHSGAGFTLIELLLTVSILALLMTITTAGFDSFIQESRRSDAVISLLQAASEAERNYLNERRYQGIAERESLKGHYSINLTLENDGQQYLVKATPAPSGSQVDDACGSFWLDSSGVRGVTPPESSENGASECWVE